MVNNKIMEKFYSSDSDSDLPKYELGGAGWELDGLETADTGLRCSPSPIQPSNQVFV